MRTQNPKFSTKLQKLPVLSFFTSNLLYNSASMSATSNKVKIELQKLLDENTKFNELFEDERLN